jgi:hypothetical protein
MVADVVRVLVVVIVVIVIVIVKMGRTVLVQVDTTHD